MKGNFEHLVDAEIVLNKIKYGKNVISRDEAIEYLVKALQSLIKYSKEFHIDEGE